jgi:hypothetical protein
MDGADVDPDLSTMRMILNLYISTGDLYIYVYIYM